MDIENIDVISVSTALLASMITGLYRPSDLPRADQKRLIDTATDFAITLILTANQKAEQLKESLKVNSEGE